MADGLDIDVEGLVAEEMNIGDEESLGDDESVNLEEVSRAQMEDYVNDYDGGIIEG